MQIVTICDKNDLELQQSKNFGKYLIEHLKITTKNRKKSRNGIPRKRLWR